MLLFYNVCFVVSLRMINISTNQQLYWGKKNKMKILVIMAYKLGEVGS